MFKIMAVVWVTFLTTLAIGDVGEAFPPGTYTAWTPVMIALVITVSMLLGAAAWEEIREDD